MKETMKYLGFAAMLSHYELYSCSPHQSHFLVLCHPIAAAAVAAAAVAVVESSLAMEKLIYRMIVLRVMITMKMNEPESRPYQHPQTLPPKNHQKNVAWRRVAKTYSRGLQCFPRVLAAVVGDGSRSGSWW